VSEGFFFGLAIRSGFAMRNFESAAIGGSPTSKETDKMANINDPQGALYVVGDPSGKSYVMSNNAGGSPVVIAICATAREANWYITCSAGKMQ
jgi:hypothetical protein